MTTCPTRMLAGVAASFLFWALSPVVLGGSASASPPAPNSIRTAVGVITDSCTGTHIADSLIVISPLATSPNNDPTAVESNPGGAYRADISGLTAEQFIFMVSAEGFETQTLLLPAVQDPPLLTPGGVFHVNVALQPLGPSGGC